MTSVNYAYFTMREREPVSVPGDFYVESHCCTSCGVPQAVAPSLVGWKDEPMSHCYWMKQPETHEELHQAFLILDGQELGCHRYAGRDPEIQARLGPENCDNAFPNLKAWWPARIQHLHFLAPERKSWIRRVFDIVFRRRQM